MRMRQGYKKKECGRDKRWEMHRDQNFRDHVMIAVEQAHTPNGPDEEERGL